MGVLPGAEAGEGESTADDAGPPAGPMQTEGIQGSGVRVSGERQEAAIAGHGQSRARRRRVERLRQAQPSGGRRTAARATLDTRHPTAHDTATATPTVTRMGTRTAAATAYGHGDISAALLARAGVLLKDSGPNTARSEQFAEFQSDAPACDNCGAITVRNGNCYLCHNCGTSMGCS